MSRNRIPDVARHGMDPEDYTRLGMQPLPVQPWEDGIRTTGAPGEFEWWYFDSRLEDGSSLVVVFFTTPMMSTRPGFHPFVTLTLTRPDGTVLQDQVNADRRDCSFSRERCDVKIGKNTFAGDLNHYTIQYRSERAEADIELDSNVNPWRPGTGHIFFGKRDYFAWIPAVPEGSVTVQLRTIGRSETLTGTGYHDHNWGNAPMMRMMHHWYWGRAQVGDYQIISSYITGQEKYGYPHFPIFMLAKGRELIGDDTRYLTFLQLEPVYDPVVEKHYHKVLVYDYDTGTDHYRITYHTKSFLEQGGMGGSNPLTGLALKAMKLAPAYDRFTGSVKVERFDGTDVIETVEASGIWELMYFGLDRNV